MSPETVLRMAREVLETPITESEAQALAGLLGGLMAEMDAMRKMNTEGAEPATLYEARP